MEGTTVTLEYVEEGEVLLSTFKKINVKKIRSGLNEDPDTAIYHSADTNAGFAIIQNVFYVFSFSFSNLTFYILQILLPMFSILRQKNFL